MRKEARLHLLVVTYSLQSVFATVGRKELNVKYFLMILTMSYEPAPFGLQKVWLGYNYSVLVLSSVLGVLI